MFPPSPTRFSRISLAQLGEKEEAFSLLERAYEDRDAFMCQLLVAPLLDPLRSDPRFQNLVKRVGLH